MYNKSPIQRMGGGGIGTIIDTIHCPLHNISANLGPGWKQMLSPKAFTDCPRIIDIPFSYRVINHFPSVTDTPPSVTGNHKEPQRLTNSVSKYLYTTVDRPVIALSRGSSYFTKKKKNRRNRTLYIFCYLVIKIQFQVISIVNFIIRSVCFIVTSPNDNI